MIKAFFQQSKTKILNLLLPIAYISSVYMQKKQILDVLTEDETINKLKKGYSISRFGDGEFNIILKNQGIYFQDFDESLKERLIKIVKINQIPNSKFLKGIVPLLKSYKGYNKSLIKWWSIYNFINRNKIFQFLNNEHFANAMFCRLLNHKLEPLSTTVSRLHSIISIWDNKDIIIIENEKTQLGINNNLLINSNSVKRILIPNNNAWTYYNQILDTTLEITRSNCIILIIAGPTATVLAHELYLYGYQAIDLGQLNEVYNKLASSFPYLISDKTLSFNKSQYFNQIYKVIG